MEQLAKQKYKRGILHTYNKMSTMQLKGVQYKNQTQKSKIDCADSL